MTTSASTNSGRLQARELPAEVTSFIGRRREITEVKRLLSKSRMVTLTGMGGVGKTRLAERVADEVHRAFADGVWLVELAELRDPKLLAQAVSAALKGWERSSLPPLEDLTDHLRDKQTLVVLDNCEHLLQDSAVVTERLLRSAPALRVLATSRQALGIPGEQVLVVPSLSLPDCNGARPSLVSLTQSEAVQLFTERARTVLPGFAVTEANRDAVEQICRKLDGIPLAIELAAVRLQALSAQQLLDRLEDRFRLLTNGSRSVPPRHQTLRALIDWSYTLSTDQERLLWARVSVFAGGLDLEAAEEVCSGDGIDREEVIDLMAALVDKSILLQEARPSTVRYRLLDTVRQYGRERLAEFGHESTLRRRHRDYYQELSAKARAQLFGPSVNWIIRLRADHANLRAALDYSFTEPTTARAGLSMATDLFYHWATACCYLSEGRRWLKRGLAADTEPSRIRAHALRADGCLALAQGDIASAEARLEESRALGKRFGDESVLAYAALYSGLIAMDHRGDERSAIPLYEEALARQRAAGDPLGLVITLIWLCLAYSLLGDTPRAVSLGEEAVALCDAHEAGWARATAMMMLAIALCRQGDTRRAAALAKESLEFHQSLGHLLEVGINLAVLAWTAAAESRYERAARLLGVLRTVWRLAGAPKSAHNAAAVAQVWWLGSLSHSHDACESRIHRVLGERAFHTAVRRGAELPYEAGLTYALREHTPAGKSARSAKKTGRMEPLTRRETEIAQLVAKGLSNREIATTLVIAQRTAEGHIERVLSKLGFNSRIQIVGWVGEQSRIADDEPQ